MKYLKRKHARLVTVLMVAAIAFAFLPVVAHDVFDAHSLVWAFLGVTGASACVIGMLVAQILFLRCPCCGQGYARTY